MNKRLGLYLLLWLLISLLAAGNVLAQNTSAALSGHITDAAGKPVVGAMVEIVHVPSNTSKSVTTEADGRYSTRGLRVGGPFKVTVIKDGMTKVEKDNIYLALAEETNVSLQMTSETAVALEALTVTAAAPSPIFQPDNKGLSTNISQRELKVLPNPDRSIQSIARMDPMINITNKSRGEISAVGQNSRYNNITIDAVPTNDSFGLEANGLPSLNQPISFDAIEEYNISTANYDVTSKRAVGANVNIVTKTGSNDFHGSAYYAYRNADDMVGEGVNDTPFTGYKQQWTAGGTFSGPLIEDTLFFFLNYEEAKIVAPAPDFGPIGSSKSNIVPVSQDQLDRITNIAKGYGLIPGDLNASSNNQDDKKALVKLDWNISDNHRASLRYDETQSTQPSIIGNGPNSLGLSSYWYTQDRNLKQWVANFYDDWTDSFFTETSISWASYSATPSVLAQQPQLRVFLAPGSTTSIFLGEEQFRHYNVLDVDTYNAFFAGTWVRDQHTIKAGFDFQRDKFYNLFGRTQFGAYEFQSIDDFAAGNYSNYQIYKPVNGDINSIAASWSLDQWGFFVQDTWQPISNFSLQYGLRFDVPKVGESPIYNAAFEQAFGLANNNTVDGNGVLQPRISFNYTFDTELQTQLRGGIGLSEGVTPGVWLSNPYTNNGITLTSYSSKSGQFVADPFNQPIPSGTPPAPQVDLLDSDFKLPTVLKVSLGFDRELPWWDTVFTAELAHLQAKHAVYYQNLNLGAPTGVLPDGRLSYWSATDPSLFTNPNSPKATPAANRNKNFSNVTYLTNTDQGQATDLSLALKKPFNENWFGSVGVVFGNATEVNPGTSAQAASNWTNDAVYNPNENVASTSNYDIRKRLISSLTWQHRFFGDYVTSISGFYDGHSGQPYSWIFGNDVSGICSGSSSNCPRGLAYIPHEGDVLFQSGTSATVIQQFYDFIKSNKYLQDNQGRVAQRNATNAPWINQVDLSFRQEIPGFFEGNKGEIRFDIFNFTNLLNKKWGNIYDVSFPYTRRLANFAGVDPVTGKYVYALPTSNGNYAPGSLTLADDKAQSRWSVMMTLRYQF